MNPETRLSRKRKINSENSDQILFNKLESELRNLSNNSAAIDLINEIKDLSCLTNKSGSTALHIAAICGNSVAVDSIIEKGVDPWVRDKKGLTPLYYAHTIRDDKVKKLIVDVLQRKQKEFQEVEKLRKNFEILTLEEVNKLEDSKLKNFSATPLNKRPINTHHL